MPDHRVQILLSRRRAGLSFFRAIGGLEFGNTGVGGSVLEVDVDLEESDDTLVLGQPRNFVEHVAIEDKISHGDQQEEDGGAEYLQTIPNEVGVSGLTESLDLTDFLGDVGLETHLLIVFVVLAPREVSIEGFCHSHLLQIQSLKGVGFACLAGLAGFILQLAQGPTLLHFHRA